MNSHRQARITVVVAFNSLFLGLLPYLIQKLEDILSESELSSISLWDFFISHLSLGIYIYGIVYLIFSSIYLLMEAKHLVSNEDIHAIEAEQFLFPHKIHWFAMYIVYILAYQNYLHVYDLKPKKEIRKIFENKYEPHFWYDVNIKLLLNFVNFMGSFLFISVVAYSEISVVKSFWILSSIFIILMLLVLGKPFDKLLDNFFDEKKEDK